MVQKAQDVRNESHPLSVHKTHSEEPKRHDYYYEKGSVEDIQIVLRASV